MQVWFRRYGAVRLRYQSDIKSPWYGLIDDSNFSQRSTNAVKRCTSYDSRKCQGCLRHTYLFIGLYYTAQRDVIDVCESSLRQYCGKMGLGSVDICFWPPHAWPHPTHTARLIHSVRTGAMCDDKHAGQTRANHLVEAHSTSLELLV